ncbi:unnamed protein product [Moneuplotes crassus]|uniref:Uncharacterized protein n=1 Tax=Euplotes crassus TaxID=5936 RepID=A0AAD1UCF0_EUPCR|nr:unnamed protein product [Moneuplotes crassus]
MENCNYIKKSPEVELEIPSRLKSASKNKFSEDKNLEKDLAPKYPLFYDYDPNDQCKKTLQELYTTARRCQIILKEYQSCHSGSYPLSLHQISRLISQIVSTSKNNQFWIQYRCYHKEDVIIINAFNHLWSQIDELKQELSLIHEVTENQQRKEVTLKKGHKEMGEKQGGQLTTKTLQDIPCIFLERSQEAASLNLVLTFEALYRLSCNGLSQKIYHDSYENTIDCNISDWYYFSQEPGLSLEFDYTNPERCVYAKKVSKVTLPYFESVIVNTDSKSLKLFHKCVAHFSPCSNVKALEILALELTDIALYLPQIVKICARVQKKVCLCKFNLNETQFKKFLMGCRHLEEVKFTLCKFDIPRVPDLSTCMKGTVIKKICLWTCIRQNEWRKFPEKLETLVNAISAGDLKESLKEVEFEDTLSEYFVNWIFEKYGLGHILNLG